MAFHTGIPSVVRTWPVIQTVYAITLRTENGVFSEQQGIRDETKELTSGRTVALPFFEREGL